MIFQYFSNNHKKLVVFFHGYKKQSYQWNVSEYDKELNIEKEINKFSDTILVQNEDSDYLTSINEFKFNDDFIHILRQYNKLYFISHSYGSFFVLELCKIFKPKGIVMLEPTLKSVRYKNYLESLVLDQYVDMKIRFFDTLPDYTVLHPSIIVEVHSAINNESDITLFNDINNLTKFNVNSMNIVYYGKSHMLHYDIPQTIINSIKRILRN